MKDTYDQMTNSRSQLFLHVLISFTIQNLYDSSLWKVAQLDAEAVYILIISSYLFQINFQVFSFLIFLHSLESERFFFLHLSEQKFLKVSKEVQTNFFFYLAGRSCPPDGQVATISSRCFRYRQNLLFLVHVLLYNLMKELVLILFNK